MLSRFLFVLAATVLCPIGNLAAPTSVDAMRAVETTLASPVEIVNRSLAHRSLLDEMRKNHVPALSIAVVHKGKIQWAKGYGIKQQDGAPVTTGTLFQAASISKSITTMTALVLVERHKLSLDAPINSQLKHWSVPDNDFTAQHPVTLRGLLSNTGGTSVIGFAS